MLNIVIIDGVTLDSKVLNWDRFRTLGNVTVYDEKHFDNANDELLSAEVIITNKFVMDADLIQQLPNLKCIGITATGYNVIDVDAARTHGVVVCNAPGYSTVSTAQHTIALMLELTNHCGRHHQNVIAGAWTDSNSWCDNRLPNVDVYGKTMGIIGVGAIGRQVAKIAGALGMKTIGYSRSATSGMIDNIEMVALDQVYTSSDVITLHCPLNDESSQMINASTISLIKPSAYLINASRGGLVNEEDLGKALKNGDIAGAAVDVLSSEPPSIDNPLINAPNCIITPHLAWGSNECRDRLMQITFDNIKHFIEGNPHNIVT